jgi:GT2 family glycosyltransferase
MSNSLHDLLKIASFKPESLKEPDAWCGHIPFAAWLMKTLQPDTFVELGTHTGNSYFAFCQAAKEAELNTKCFAVDTWAGDEHAGFYDDSIFSDVFNHNQSNYAEFSSLLRMTFDEALAKFDDGSIDLLHIDGLHTYEAVKHDFESWLPKLRRGAVVLFHDTQVRDRGFGVWRLWEELKQEYPNHIEFEHSHGLGVLSVEKTTPLGFFDDFASDSAEYYKSYFSAIALKNSMTLRLAALDRQKADLDRQIADRDQQLADRDQQLADRDQQLADRDQQLAEQEKSISSLASRVAALESSLSWKLTSPLRRLLEVVKANYSRKKKEREDSLLNCVKQSGGSTAQQPGRLLAFLRMLRDAWVIRASGLFDKEFYRNCRPEIPWWQSPLLHFVLWGWRQGSNPNPLFDANYYLSTYPDVREADRNPLVHYLESGWREGRNPSALFDVNCYLSIYPELRSSGLNPLVHYRTKYGKDGYLVSLQHDGFTLGTISHNPLISIVIVSCDSQNDLATCLDSIAKQTYSRLEVIVVENGSTDTRSLVENSYPGAIFVKAKQNLGFASANNLACKYAKGEYIALINPDIRLDPSCLQELIEPFRRDDSLAVTVPKLRFWERFVDVRFSSSVPFGLSSTDISDALSYKKYFVREGRHDAGSDRIFACKLSDRHILSLRLPVDGTKLRLKIVLSAPLNVEPDRSLNYIEMPHDGIVSLDLDLSVAGNPGARWIINNAGSGLNDGLPYDTGFGEYDEAFFDSYKHVDAFCGAVAVIRRAAIVGREIFRPEYFAYYEDSELSYALRKRGHRILYSPRALAYHKHSANTTEFSPLWSTLVNRSRMIYEYHIGALGADKRLAEMTAKEDRYTDVPETLKNILLDLDKHVTKKPPIKHAMAIYNSFWNSLGGGEFHALGIARALALEGMDTYLVSECDFSIAKLEKTFGVNLEGFRKLIISNISPQLTSYFTVFVNSTYCSNLRSKACLSYYVVSFPHRNIDRLIFNDYHFVYNSKFTQESANEIWGQRINGTVLYPVLGCTTSKLKSRAEKRKKMVTIGRITLRGHAKNQHVLLDAFRATASIDEAAGWELVLMGSLEESNDEDVAYFGKLKEIASTDSRVRMIANCKRDVLESELDAAMVYLHATGFGKSQNEPDLQEHFGITVVEAALKGALPVVYHGGGPLEIIQQLGHGLTYSTHEELVNILRDVMAGVVSVDHADVSRAALAMCKSNQENIDHLYNDMRNSLSRMRC